MALQCQPYGTAVPTLWDCSANPTGLQCHPYGTAVPPLWDCSANPTGLQSYPLGPESLQQESAGD